MSTSPEWRAEAPVLRGPTARDVAAANFDVDLRAGAPVPSEVVQDARAAGRTAGYAEGWAQGQRAARVAAQAAADQAAAAIRAAEAACAAALQSAVAAIGRAVADLDARRAPVLAESADTLLSAAVEITEALLGHELATGEDRGLAAVRRAVALTPDNAPVTVRLHPDDHRTLVGVGGSTYAVDGRAVSLRPDAQLAPGDAVAEYGVTTVDATIAAAVARVREALAR